MLGINQPEIKEEIEFHTNKDLSRNAITGSYIYLLVWFSLIIPNTFYLTHPGISFWFTLLLMILAALRIILIVNFTQLYQKNTFIWKLVFFPTILLPALLWGILCAVSLVKPIFGDLSIIIVIATTGLAGGGAGALIGNRFLTVGLISVLLAPSELAMLLWGASNPSLPIIFPVYWIAIFGITRIQRKTYLLSQKQSFLIRRHAAELEQLNTLDGLTGLKNRSFFDDSLQNELKRAIRNKSFISLLLVDIDHFKQVNDRFGHLVGDDCLRHISRLLRENVKRETDIVARYGGEEFAIILPGDNAEHARGMAEKIRKNIEINGFKQNEIHLPLTVSIGVSSFIPHPDCSPEEIIERADVALYKAKNNGRNQVAV